jgi:hypothetical protein
VLHGFGERRLRKLLIPAGLKTTSQFRFVTEAVVLWIPLLEVIEFALVKRIITVTPKKNE